MTNLPATKVQEIGENLRTYAEHFEQRDWNYTRQSRIKSITYKPTKRPYRDRRGTLHWFDDSELPARLWYAVKGTVRDLRGEKRILGDVFDSVGHRRMFLARLRLRPEPDGVLDDGGIIVFWEENGEYIQLMQPSVGSLVARFLLDDPNHPHAVKIAAEIGRIQDAYMARNTGHEEEE